MATDNHDPEQSKEFYFRRNVALIPPVDLFWGFGVAVTALGPILAVFLLQLGASNFLIGFLPVAALLGSSLLQLPSAHLTRHLRRKQVFFALSHLPPCAALIIAGLLAPRYAVGHPRTMIWVLLGMVAAFSAANGLLMPIWTQLFPRMFADTRRGLIGGMIVAMSGTGGLVGGLYAAHVLANRPFPFNYAHLFILAGVLELISVQAYAFGHEEIPREPPEETPHLLHSLRVLWGEDRRLRRFLFVRSLSEVGLAASAFFAVYATKRWGLPPSTGGTFVIAMSLGSATTGLLGGRLGDRRGYRRVMGWALGCSAVATLLALLSRDPRWFYPAFFLLGAGVSGDWMSSTNLLIEMAPEERRAYYYAMFSTAMAPARLIAPLAWGWLGDSVGLPWVFAGGLALQIAGMALLLALVDDPRRPGQRLLRWRWGSWAPRLY